MPTRRATRLTIHPTSDPLRFSWSLMLLVFDPQGVPSARMVQHGVVDLQDPDPVGIEVVAALLARAAYQEA